MALSPETKGSKLYLLFSRESPTLIGKVMSTQGVEGRLGIEYTRTGRIYAQAAPPVPLRD